MCLHLSKKKKKKNVFALIYPLDIQRVFRSGTFHPHPRVSFFHYDQDINIHWIACFISVCQDAIRFALKY